MINLHMHTYTHIYIYKEGMKIYRVRQIPFLNALKNFFYFKLQSFRLIMENNSIEVAVVSSR